MMWHAARWTHELSKPTAPSQFVQVVVLPGVGGRAGLPVVAAVSHHHKILDYLESYHGGTGRTRGAQTLREGKSLIFPIWSGKPISMSTLRKMRRHHRIASVAHGFRSSLRDWAAEETDHPWEVIEVALAHVVTNKCGGGQCAEG